MTVLAWLAVPVIATLLAVLWVLWRSRPRPPADVHDTVEDYQRFKQVFEQPRWRSGRPDPSGELPPTGTEGTPRGDEPTDRRDRR